MKYHKLGNSQIEISAMGLGTNRFSDPGDAESVAAFKAALERGITFIDTADSYMGGNSEKFIGIVLKGRRDKAVITTKFGMGAPGGVNGRPEYVVQACEASLKRLGTDVIDLYYQHRLDPDVPIEDTVGAMASLVKAGKVRALGLSEVTPTIDNIRRAHAIHPISALQVEYSLYARFAEENLFPLCEELGITCVAWGPLGYGFAADAVASIDTAPSGGLRLRRLPRFRNQDVVHDLELLRPVKDIADAIGCTPVQLALTWVLARPEGVIPIPGSTRPAHVTANADAVDIRLTPEQLERLDSAFS